MDKARFMLQRRPFALSVVGAAVVLVVGVMIGGPNFIESPIPLPQWIADTWLTCNMVFALITMAVTYRNLLKYEERFNWQETFVLRGMCWLFMGMALSYSTHLLTGVAFVTVGTPAVTVGILSVLYGALRDPDRFVEE